MQTKFTKMDEKDGIPKWSSFFAAGDAWLQSLQVLEDNKDHIGWGIFYVKPWIVSFCLELFVKAIAIHKDNTFISKNYGHAVTRILDKYKGEIPIFKRIFNDSKLMQLIKEYENTIDTKYGETYVQIEGKDQNRILEIVYELRGEISKRTGLR